MYGRRHMNCFRESSIVSREVLFQGCSFATDLPIARFDSSMLHLTTRPLNDRNALPPFHPSAFPPFHPSHISGTECNATRFPSVSINTAM